MPEKRFLSMASLVSSGEFNCVDRLKPGLHPFFSMYIFTITLIGHINFIVERKKMHGFRRDRGGAMSSRWNGAKRLVDFRTSPRKSSIAYYASGGRKENIGSHFATLLIHRKQSWNTRRGEQHLNTLPLFFTAVITSSSPLTALRQ